MMEDFGYTGVKYERILLNKLREDSFQAHATCAEINNVRIKLSQREGHSTARNQGIKYGTKPSKPGNNSACP